MVAYNLTAGTHKPGPTSGVQPSFQHLYQPGFFFFVIPFSSQGFQQMRRTPSFKLLLHECQDAVQQPVKMQNSGSR